MSDTGVAQLTDVSMTQIDEQRAGRGLPGKDTGLRWNAPETFQGSPLTLSSDVFSFALLCVDIDAKDERDSNKNQLARNTYPEA